MEILMKLKCSPTGPGNTPSLSTIKIINHQQPVKQHSVGGTTSALHLQGKPSTIINHHHHHPHHPHLSRSQPQPQTQSHHSNHPQHLQGHSQNMSAMIQDILPQGRPAVVVPNATSSPIDCCIGMPRSFITRPSVPPPSNNDCTNLCYEGSTQFCPSSVTSNQHSSVSPGGLSCNGPSNVRPPTLALCNTQQSVIVNRTAPPTIISSRTLKPNIPGPSVYANGSYDLHPINQQQSSLQGGYAYEDTEEDFVSIDDAKIKSFLMKMGNKPQNSPNRQETPTPPQSNTPVKMDEDDDDTILTFDEEFPKQKRLVSPLSINKTPVALRRDITTINAALNNTATAKKSSPSPSIPNQKTETNRINQESKDTLENNKSLINNNINNNDKNNINNNNNNIINNNNNTSNKIPNTNTNNNNSNSKTLEYQRPQSSPSTNGFNSSKEAIQRNGTNNSSQEIPSNGVGNPRKEITNIVANIDLLDSSDEEDVNEQEPPFDDNVYEEDEVDVDEDDDDDDDDDEDDYPLAALSCELQLEDEDDLPLVPATKRPRYNELNGGDITDIESDLDDDDIADYIVGKERGVELKWDDFRDKQPNAPPAVSINSSTSVQSNSQKDKDFQAHECHLCGKVVQSSYNLRRHMMIHTGERPFGCDMCERRFREFSDLKKHRRRHLNEPGYICMICRIGKPSTTDSTRCYTCEYKQIPPKFFADKYKPTSAAADLANEAYSVALSAVMNEYRKSPPIASQPPPPPPPPPTLAKKPSMNHNSGKSSPPSLQQAPRISPVNLVYTPTPPPLPAQGQTQAQAQSQVQAQAQATKRAATPPLPPLTPISRSSSTSSHSDAWLSQISNMQTSKSPSINGSSSSNSNTNNTNSNGQSGLKKEFQCPLCDRSFGTRHNLKRHFMIHTGEKPFSCSECRKPFRESSTLKKHMVTHLRDRWYKCSRCSHAFHDYLDYMDHKLVHDGEEDSDTLMTNDTMDETELRRRSYEIYDSNDEDEDEDDEEDWLDCYECNQRFTNLDEYNEHIKEHDLNHSSYECYICKKHFESREILEKHITLCKRE